MRLKEIRKAKGISQLKLATDLHTNQNTISRYETGEREPGLAELIRIADYLDGYPMQIEQSDSLIEVYTLNGIDYYLFNNEDQIQAAWVNGRFECVIFATLSLDEIKTMINSIEKG